MQKRQNFISFQMFLFLAFASRRHLLPPLLSCASVPLLLLGCSCSVSAQNQGKRAKVHFVLIFSLCLEAQAKRSNKNTQNATEAKRSSNKNTQNATEAKVIFIFIN